MTSEEMIGKKFGRLTVLGIAPTPEYVNSNNSTFLYCQCDCGNKVIINKKNILSNHTISCGCYHPTKYKNNSYIKIDNYLLCFDENNNSFKIDIEDYDRIKDYYFSKTKAGYFMCRRKEKRFLLHKLIMNDIDNNYVIDHINNDKSDNRKCNLRIVTHQQNMFNTYLRSTNTSGVTGVSWENSRNKWSAKICFNGKTIHLGRFENFDDAVKARKDAEVKYFGEYSYDYSQTYLTNNNIN